MNEEKKTKIVAIDDEPQIGWLMSRILAEEGYQPLVADNGQDGLELIQRERPELVLLDLRLPGLSGIEILRRVREFDKEQMVIILSAFESFEAAVQALKLGAYDFLTKPINVEEMKVTLKNALHTRTLVREVQSLKLQVEESRRGPNLIGNSPAMEEIARQMDLVSRHNISILILGESGTGKELLARAIHNQSLRSQEAFVCIDCSTIPENLIESELFGFERGAFTGAAERKLGRLEMANRGTLFLDEVGNMPASMQMKLLRVIQERTLTRLGGKHPIPIDIRLISATNLDIRQSLASGAFREDLYYRLNEFTLTLPPLRERGEDHELLGQYFLERFNREFHKSIQGFTPEARQCLEAYAWPGNVREFQAAIKRAVIFAKDWIGLEHLPPEVAGPGPGVSRSSFWVQAGLEEIRPIKEVSRRVVAQVERELIQRALAKSRGNKIQCARWLGIDYKTLFNKLRQYGMESLVRPHLLRDEKRPQTEAAE